MATIQLFLAPSSTSPVSISGISGTVTEPTPTSFCLNGSNAAGEPVVQVFAGEFDYTSDESVNNSKITALSVSINGEVAWSFEGISITIAQYKGLFSSSVPIKLASLEALFAGDDNVTGFDGANGLFSYGGNDTLFAKGGNDTLDGGLGIDLMYGGAGDDLYIIADSDYLGNPLDIVVEEFDSGIDKVETSISYMLGANLENLTLTGGASLINGSGNDLANIILGNGGANLLQGFAANDTLIGGEGNDTLDGGIGADLLWRGSQSDDFVTRPGSSPAATELLNDSIQGVSDFDELTFANGVDVVGPGYFLLPEDYINYGAEGTTAFQSVKLENVTNASGLTSLDPFTAYQVQGSWRPDLGFKFIVSAEGSDVLFFVTSSVGGAWATGATDLIGTQSLVLDDVRYF